jgi:hypothetical protein
VDHDDLLAPDCVRVLTHELVRHAFPAYAYTDEDKLDGQNCRDPYFKPDWDPVLFSASCYIAHMIVFERSRALELGAYTDRRVEGSHDWDTFTRFAGAGLVPLHIAEVLYTWRMHSLSTAGNFQSKPYVFTSQRVVLEKIVAQGAWPDRFHVEPSPLFEGTPDGWIRRDRVEPRGIVTALVGARDETRHGAAIDPAIQHEWLRCRRGAGAVPWHLWRDGAQRTVGYSTSSGQTQRLKAPSGRGRRWDCSNAFRTLPLSADVSSAAIVSSMPGAILGSGGAATPRTVAAPRATPVISCRCGSRVR